MRNQAAISVEGLTKYYNGLLAVDQIQFQVKQGEIFGFLGPNGAGKTTTIRMLCMLLTPSGGLADILGFDLRKDRVEIKSRIGVVPEVSNLYDELTCLENLIFMGQLYGVAKIDRKKKAEELLRFFRLEGKRDALFSGLSKGMKRSLTIAAALVHDPPLIFLDEPTSGLDVMSARNLRALIKSLNRGGKTIFLTTHNIEEANLLCHRIAIMVKGKVIAIDSPEAGVFRAAAFGPGFSGRSIGWKDNWRRLFRPGGVIGCADGLTPLLFLPPFQSSLADPLPCSLRPGLLSPRRICFGGCQGGFRSPDPGQPLQIPHDISQWRLHSCRHPAPAYSGVLLPPSPDIQRRNYAQILASVSQQPSFTDRPVGPVGLFCGPLLDECQDPKENIGLMNSKDKQ